MLFISFWTAAEEGITYGLEKTEGAMKIGETRWTGNIGYTRHKTKIYKTKNTTQRTDERHGSHQKLVETHRRPRMTNNSNDCLQTITPTGLAKQ